MSNRRPAFRIEVPPKSPLDRTKALDSVYSIVGASTAQQSSMSTNWHSGKEGDGVLLHLADQRLNLSNLSLSELSVYHFAAATHSVTRRDVSSPGSPFMAQGNLDHLEMGSTGTKDICQQLI